MRTYDLLETAEFLKVDRTTVLELAGTGQITGAKIGRSWVFLEDELVEYLRAQSRKQTAERLAKAEISKVSEGRQVVYVTPPERVSRRKPIPALPQLVGELTAS